MLVSEVITVAKAQANEDYADARWIEFINFCLDDLTPWVKNLKTKAGVAVTLTAGNGSITISSDADIAKNHEILDVYFTPTGGLQAQLRRLYYSERQSKGWRLSSAQILFQNCGSVNGTSAVDYYESLQHVSLATDNITTVSGLPVEYHPLIINYCIAKANEKEEKLTDKNSVYVEYLRGKKQFAVARARLMEPHNLPYLLPLIDAITGGG